MTELIQRIGIGIVLLITLIIVGRTLYISVIEEIKERK